MHIYCVADIHGRLPQPPHLDIDLAVIAGDLCPETGVIEQTMWLQTEFKWWLARFPKAVWVAGNHDYCYDKSPMLIAGLEQFGPDYYYLRDAGCEVDGLSVWGSPWSLPFGNYSFYCREGEMARRYEGIPGKLDVLVSHGPPKGCGDLTHDGWHTGSRSLLHVIEERQPPLAVVGHIHESRGVYNIGETVLVNAACEPVFVVMDDDHKVVETRM